MATYYVDNSVGGPGTGAIGDPWDDLESNFNATGAAGDTFYIVGDVLAPRDYNEGEVTLSTNGTAANRITIAPSPGTQVCWKSGAGNDTFHINGDYITVQDFEFDKEEEWGNAIEIDGDYVHIEDCTVHNGAFDQLIKINGDYAIITRCTIYDNDDGAEKDAVGVLLDGSTGTTISYCTIYDCCGDCIHIWDNNTSDAVTIEYNELYTTLGMCSECGVDSKDCRPNQSYIRYNTFHGFRACDGSCGGTGQLAGPAIYLHRQSENFIIEFNTFYDVTSGMMIQGSIDDVTIRRNIFYDLFAADPNAWASFAIYIVNQASNQYIYNNTFDNCQDEVLRFDDCTVTVKNNLFFDTESIVQANAPTVTADYNGWFDATDTIAGANDVGNADPKFVDQPNHDYHLLVTSTCIDAGVDVGLPFNGAAPDIGRYEFGGGEETTTSTSTTTTSTSTTSTSTTTTSTSTTSTSTSSSTTTTTSTSTSTTSTSMSTSTTSTSTTSTSTTSTSTTSTSTSTTSTSTTTTSTSTTSTSSSTSTTLLPLELTCPGTEKDQILVPISGGFKAYSLLNFLGVNLRKLRSTANFGMAPMHVITQRGPFQDGDTPIDMRWDTRVIQVMLAETLHDRWDYWERHHSLLDKLRANRSFDPAEDAPRPLVYRKWLPNGGFLQGTDAVTTAHSRYITSNTGRFIEFGLEAGQRFDLTSGNDEGGFIVASVPNDYTVELTTHMLHTATGVKWIYRRGWGIRDLNCLLEAGPTFDEGPGASPSYPTGYEEVLRFVAHDPFWYGQEQQESYEMPADIDALIFGGGGAWFDAAGEWLFADGFVSESHTIVYWGSAPARPVIEIVGPANNTLIENETTGVQLLLGASIPRGTTVTIDTLELTAKDGDDISWMQHLDGDLVTFAIEAPPQAPNRENTITISFANAKYGVSEATLTWKNRYTGI